MSGVSDVFSISQPVSSLCALLTVASLALICDGAYTFGEVRAHSKVLYFLCKHSADDGENWQRTLRILCEATHRVEERQPETTESAVPTRAGDLPSAQRFEHFVH